MDKEPCRWHQAAWLTSIGANMLAEGSNPWHQLCVVIYHKFQTAAGHAILLWDKLAMATIQGVSPWEDQCESCCGDLCSVGFWKTVTPETKHKRVVLFGIQTAQAQTRWRQGSDRNQGHGGDYYLCFCESLLKMDGVHFLLWSQNNQVKLFSPCTHQLDPPQWAKQHQKVENRASITSPAPVPCRYISARAIPSENQRSRPYPRRPAQTPHSHHIYWSWSTTIF